MKQQSAITGEYCRVADKIKNQELLQTAYFTPVTEHEAEMLVKHYCPNADVIFYPDIRSCAVDTGGNHFIRFCNNPMTQSDIEQGLVYPRLQLGVVLHEIAHLKIGVYNYHNPKFCMMLDAILKETEDNKWKEIIAAETEKQNSKKKIAKSISRIVQQKCPICNKPPEIVSSFEDLTTIYHQLTCGHLMTVPKVKKGGIASDFKSVKGEPLYSFQVENVEKFQEANGRLCIFDEMGLGKTPSSIAISHIFKLHPTLVICKSGLKHQWKRMTEYWGNTFDEDLGISEVNTQVIQNGKDYPFLGAHFYIVSYDLLSNLPENFFRKAKLPNGKEVPLNIKLAIIDECQHIKNPESQRTRAVFEICKDIPNIVFTSGTPIKNSGIEFYPTLHMVDPIRFPTKAKFASDWVDTYTKGPYIKYGGIRNFDKFQKATEKFIIRHTQSEVLPDLPDITRDFIYTELSGKEGNKYAEVAKRFADYYYKTSKEDKEFMQNILAFFVEMRHITGRAKVQEAIDFAIDFLTSTDRKLTIFTHHIDVREEIVAGINKFLIENEMKPCLELVGSMNSDKKEDLKTKFNFDPSYRILVASTLASGEGHNLQYACSDCLMIERQWNPANEEQAEFRFKRPGQKSAVIRATYLIAEETIDEYFTKLVEDKRMMMKHALDGTKMDWNQNTILTELAQVIASRSSKVK